ncbi:MAG: hypothetical protein V1921_06785 [Candidatus Altiarchaeota archaeon]
MTNGQRTGKPSSLKEGLKRGVQVAAAAYVVKKALEGEKPLHEKPDEILQERMNEDLMWPERGQMGMERDLTMIRGPIHSELLIITNQLSEAVQQHEANPSEATASRIRELGSVLDSKKAAAQGAMGRLEDRRGMREGNVLRNQPTEVFRGDDSRMDQLGVLEGTGTVFERNPGRIKVELKPGGAPTLVEADVDFSTRNIRGDALANVDRLYEKLDEMSKSAGVKKMDLLKAASRVAEVGNVGLRDENGRMNPKVEGNIRDALRVRERLKDAGIDANPLEIVEEAVKKAEGSDNPQEALSRALSNVDSIAETIGKRKAA